MTPSFPDAFVRKLIDQEASVINAFRRLVEKVESRTEEQLRRPRASISNRSSLIRPVTPSGWTEGRERRSP